MQKKISEKYKQMRNKKQSIPFDLEDMPDHDIISYNDGIILQDTNMNKNTILAAKKISDKYKNIRRKRTTNIESNEKDKKNKSIFFI